MHANYISIARAPQSPEPAHNDEDNVDVPYQKLLTTRDTHGNLHSRQMNPELHDEHLRSRAACRAPFGAVGRVDDAKEWTSTLYESYHFYRVTLRAVLDYCTGVSGVRDSRRRIHRVWTPRKVSIQLSITGNLLKIA